MGREKLQVKKIGAYGVICSRLGERPPTFSTPQRPVTASSNFVQDLMIRKTQMSGDRNVIVADTVSIANAPFPTLPGGRLSIFDPRHPVNLSLAEPIVRKRKAVKTTAERDVKALKIEGNKKLDPRKSHPTMFDLQTADGRRGMTTRGSIKTGSSGNGENGRSVSLVPQKRAKRKATEAGLSMIRTEAPPIQDAPKKAPSRHDSVAAGSDTIGSGEAVQISANGLSSSPRVVATAHGTKRRKVLPSNDDVVESLSLDIEMVSASKDAHPSRRPVSNITPDRVGSHNVAIEGEMVPSGLSAGEGPKERAIIATISKAGKRKRTLEQELQINGTPALGRSATTDADRYRKSYKAANGKWYSWLGTEKPDWAVDERDVDLGGVVSEGYTNTSSRGRPRRTINYHA